MTSVARPDRAVNDSRKPAGLALPASPTAADAPVASSPLPEVALGEGVSRAFLEILLEGGGLLFVGEVHGHPQLPRPPVRGVRRDTRVVFGKTLVEVGGEADVALLAKWVTVPSSDPSPPLPLLLYRIAHLGPSREFHLAERKPLSFPLVTRGASAQM